MMATPVKTSTASQGSTKADAFVDPERVMVVAPVDADVDEAEQVGQEPVAELPRAWRVGSSGTFSSRTMMVMMMASTPSLNASS